FGPFLGFWAAFEGAARRGNLAIPAGGMSTEARLRMLANVEATTVCCTPTYALRMAEVAAAEGLELASLPVERLIVAGEPGGNVTATRERIESAWNADCYDHWGMTEVGPLATAVEGDKDALYVLETDCVAEILRREADEPVDAGEVGELVVTNLGRLGSPVLRYRTGDLVRAATTPSPVGLEFLRLEGGVLGRVDDMLTVRGNNVFPSAIEAVVRRFDGVAEYRVVVTESTSLTELRVDVEPAPDADAPSIAREVGRALAETLNFRIAVAAVPADSLPRFEMKGKRVVREQSED
ncbi:MAG: AMP-binding protein, partial [Planctomycetota bacterium]